MFKFSKNIRVMNIFRDGSIISFIIIINILIYHKCLTYSGELTLVNSERIVANAEDASAKSV